MFQVGFNYTPAAASFIIQQLRAKSSGINNAYIVYIIQIDRVKNFVIYSWMASICIPLEQGDHFKQKS